MLTVFFPPLLEVGKEGGRVVVGHELSALPAGHPDVAQGGPRLYPLHLGDVAVEERGPRPSDALRLQPLPEPLRAPPRVVV